MLKERYYNIKDLAEVYGVRKAWIYEKIKKTKYNNHVTKISGVKVLDEFAYKLLLEDLTKKGVDISKCDISKAENFSENEYEDITPAKIDIEEFKKNAKYLDGKEKNQEKIEAKETEETENEKISENNIESARIEECNNDSIEEELSVEIVELANMEITTEVAEQGKVMDMLKSENYHLRSENLKLLNIIDGQNDIVKREQEIVNNALTHSEKMLLLKKEELDIRKKELVLKEGRGLRKFFRKIFG